VPDEEAEVLLELEALVELRQRAGKVVGAFRAVLGLGGAHGERRLDTSRRHEEEARLRGGHGRELLALPLSLVLPGRSAGATVAD